MGCWKWNPKYHYFKKTSLDFLLFQDANYSFWLSLFIISVLIFTKISSSQFQESVLFCPILILLQSRNYFYI